MLNLHELKVLLGQLSREELGLLCGRSWLSDSAIISQMKAGNIVIDPFDRLSLTTDSYDVTLGEYYWREQEPEGGMTTYNPWSESDVARVWGHDFNVAEPARKWKGRFGGLENINPDDRVIWIRPGETILCHTQQFIGGRGGVVTTMMKARSSIGRNFIEVCKCAGKGDVGFTNRWTMEVTNNSRFYQIPLVVGRRVAQILFFEVEKILDKGENYTKAGKYQSSVDMEEVKANWNPRDMLPKMYKDREIKR